MAIPADASIGIRRKNRIYVGVGILVARYARMQDFLKYWDSSSAVRRMLRLGASIGMPTGIYGEYKTRSRVGVLMEI